MGKDKGLIEVRIAGLSDGVYEYDFVFRASDFEKPPLAEPEFCHELHAAVRVSKTESEITVEIETKTVAEFTCDICLAPLKKELRGFYRLFFVFGDNAHRGEKDGDFRVLDRNASSIDLTEDVRETLLLSKPLKMVCTDNPACAMYQQKMVEETGESKEPQSSWKESLEKLREKYNEKSSL